MNARYLLSNIMQYTGANALALARRRDALTVLCYHRVLDADHPARSRTHPALVTRTHVFEQQMLLLKERFHPIALTEATEWLDRRQPLPRRAVLVTFDDGWADTYTNAFTVMKRLDIPGVVFLATAFIGTNRRQWADIAYEAISTGRSADAAASEVERLKRLSSEERPDVALPSPADQSPNLTWSQVEEMARHGFEFGSHTRNHLILPRESEARAREELFSSAEDMCARLGVFPATFAYPDGQYNDESMQFLDEAGYRFGFTCNEGVVRRQSSRPALPRLGIHDGVSTTASGDFSRAVFLTYLAGTIPWRRRRSAT